MAVEITMPQLSDTMSEGRILTWLKKEGEKVNRGDALAEVATDKADLEIESFHEGVLVKIQAPEGTTVTVGSVIALIADAGEAQTAKPQAAAPAPQQAAPQQPVAQPQTQSQPAPQPERVAAPITATSFPSTAPQNGHDKSRENELERIRISPLAKNIAESYGVDVNAVQGSGEGGRIIRRDVESVIGGRVDVQSVIAAKGAPLAPPPVATPPRVEHAPMPGGTQAVKPLAPIAPSVSAHASTEPLSKMRATIAQRMVESKTTIPHFYMTGCFQVDALAKMRETLKTLSQYEGLTYNHLILRATAMALRAVPRVNAVYKDGSLYQPQDINVGIITAVNDGLLIPVLKHADQLSLADTVSEAKALVQRARSGRPKSDDLMGGTFSVSNMGMFPVESFSAIISPGQGGILAVSSIREEPVVAEGTVRPGLVMRVTLSVDHRIIDGVVAGEFLKEFERVIHNPVLLVA